MSERHHLEDTGIDRTILKRIVKKSVGKTWTGLIWRRRGTVGGNAVMNFETT
jgi:hypothetical protein